jgi:hypothetical protein
MLDKLVFHEGDYVYIRFKALIWHSNCLIEHSTVFSSSMKLLEDIYSNIEPTKPLVVSFKGVVDLGDKALDNFFGEIVNKTKRPIIFIHNESFSDNIIQAILRLDADNRPRYESDISELGVLKVCCSVAEDNVVKELIKKVDKAEDTFLKKAISGCHKRIDQRLLSTVVSANVEFDAAKIISEPHVFIWICLFMADKISAFIKTFLIGEQSNPNPSNPNCLKYKLILIIL